MEPDQSITAWQTECTNKLAEAVAAGRAGRGMWEAFRAAVPELQRIVVGPANFDGKSLAGFDLSRCYFARVTFKAANLSNANLSQCIFVNCDASGANIEGANFRDADMKANGLILKGARSDDETLFEVAPELLTDELPQELIDASIRARRKRLWRRRKSYSLAVRFMFWLTEHGFSFHRLVLVGLGVILGFTAIFAFDGNGLPAAFLASVAYFLNASTSHEPGLFLAAGLFEALLGMLFFAVLTALLVSILFDKN